MKKIILIIIIIFIRSSLGYSQLSNYDTNFVLLSSPNFDYKNPQFDKSQGSINYQIRDCIFAYEKWSSSAVSNIAVRFMKHNSLTAEIELTSDLFTNKNVAVAYYTNQSTVENSKGAVVFQSNKNGNWDIFFSEYNQTSWNTPAAVTTGSEDESSPSIVSYTTNNIVNYLIAYQRGDDIFVKNYFNGVWMNEINVTSADSLRCISPKLTKGAIGVGYIYMAYLRRLNDSTNSISFHRNQISTAGDFLLGNKKIIYQPKSQDNIRFSNGWNYPILNYDYDSLGHKNFYFATIDQENYTIANQTRGFSGSNYGGTGSSHGDITDVIGDRYSFYSWIRKANDSTQIVICRVPDIFFDNTLRKFYIGNGNTETFVNTSSKLIFENKYRIRILWEKIIDGRTAIVESFRDDFLTSVSNISNIAPENFSLEQNYPNPFNPKTIITYLIPTTQYSILKVYDVLGKVVATLVNEKQNAGSYSVEFNGSDLPSGIYFYRLTDGNNSDVRKMTLLK